MADQHVDSDSRQLILSKGVAGLESTEVAENVHGVNSKMQNGPPPRVAVFVLGVILDIILNIWGSTPYASYCRLVSDVVAWVEGYKALYWRQRWITSALDLVLGTGLNHELSCVLWGCIVGGTALSVSSNARICSRSLLGLVHRVTFGARPALTQGSCFGETAVVPAVRQGGQRQRLQGRPTLELLR